MKPETGVAIIGAVAGLVVGMIAGGIPDFFTGAMYGVIGGAVAVGTYEVMVRWAKS